MNLHLATCQSWVSACPQDCSCIESQCSPWRIRHEPQELFPWAVLRRTGSQLEWDRLMSCSTYDRAFDLVQAMIWLGARGLRGERV